MIKKEHFLNYRTHKIFVQELILAETPNHAPTLVFLHDALGCTDSWKSFPEMLASSLALNAIVFDRPGHGKSSASQKERSIHYLEAAALEILPFVLDQLKIEKTILVGISDGASIALIYGAYFSTPLAILAIAGHIKVESITLAGVKRTFEKLQKKDFFKKLENLHGAKTKKLLDNWANIWLSESFRDWTIASILPQITCPTLALQGADDEYATPQHCHEIAQAIGPLAESQIIDNCGHFPHLEKPDQVRSIFQYFFKNQNHV